MNGWLVYLIILIDICLRYFHLTFLNHDAVVEWLAFLSTEAARKIETPVVLLLLTAAVKGLPRQIVWLWTAWLILDFGEQILDKNYGAQLWELVMFLLGCIFLTWLDWKRQKVG